MTTHGEMTPEQAWRALAALPTRECATCGGLGAFIVTDLLGKSALPRCPDCDGWGRVVALPDRDRFASLKTIAETDYTRYRLWRREQPHWCAACGVPLNQDQVRAGNDGSILCPDHIGTVA